MAAHYAGLCAESAAAYIGERQRAWLTAIDQEQDNLRAALEWAVANDDAETALTIAGGASWPHWLAGTLVEGRRWLDDAFACGGEASESTRALALTGRGLIEFLTGAPDRADADLEAALAHLARAPRRPVDRCWRTPSTPRSPPCGATSTRPAGAGARCSPSTTDGPRIRS